MFNAGRSAAAKVSGARRPCSTGTGGAAQRAPLPRFAPPRPKKGASGPHAPSTGHELLQLRIHRRRRQLGPELEEHLIDELTKPGEGAIGAGLTEDKEEAQIETLQPAAAVEVRMAERVSLDGAALDAPKAAGRGQGPAQRAWPDP